MQFFNKKDGNNIIFFFNKIRKLYLYHKNKF